MSKPVPRNPGESSPPRPLLIRQAQLVPGGWVTDGLVDVRIADGRIAAIAPGLPRVSGETEIDACGGVLLPGLIDHHLHLFATAAARASVPCGPPQVTNEAQLASALRQRVAGSDAWLRGVGFHDSVCPTLDRRWLDRVCPDRPVRIQHRSGMLWVLNSCALAALGIAPEQLLPAGIERTADGQLTGRCYDVDQWLGARMPAVSLSLRDLSSELARCGVSAVTDTGARNGVAAWRSLEAACHTGELVQRLLVMGSEELDPLLSAGDDRIAVGPLKIYLREADLPDFDALVARMRAAHVFARRVAVHCVTRVELTYALAALREAGALAGDRIEHGAVADDHAVAELAALGVTVVTQPHFIAERGVQYLQDVDPDDVPWLYRGAAFLHGGVPLAAGSDAPYGTIDPWQAMRAAVQRRNGAGVVMGGNECLTPAQAVGLYGGSQQLPGAGLQQLVPGQRADLCLLDVDWDTLCRDLDRRHVALTLCGGEIIHRSSALEGS